MENKKESPQETKGLKNKKLLAVLFVCLITIAYVSAYIIRNEFIDNDLSECRTENHRIFERAGACSSYCDSLKMDSYIEFENNTFECVCVEE